MFQSIVCSCRCGSSPLARGTRGRWRCLPTCQRLIPARAGNTYAHDAHGIPKPAHPRSRGEHDLHRYWWCPGSGSSPLARGTRRSGCAFLGAARLIPARAGNTRSSASTSGCSPAHPRSRGEHQRAPGIQQFKIGSSPLARGTLRGLQAYPVIPRLIPARAGNT